MDPEVEQCKFGSIYCKKDAVTENDYGVPMCRTCFNIWDKLRRNDGAEPTNYSKVLIPKPCFAPNPSEDSKPTLYLGERKTERPENDDFFCGS